MTLKIKEPKDLGVKIGSKEEAFWTSVKVKAEEDILNAQRQIEINDLIIIHAKTRIAQEKETFK